MFWQIAVFVASFVASYLLTPKPKNKPPDPIQNVEFPTADVGREIPVLFGTRKISGPNVVWYGDLRTVAIKSKGGKK